MKKLLFFIAFFAICSSSFAYSTWNHFILGYYGGAITDQYPSSQVGNVQFSYVDGCENMKTRVPFQVPSSVFYYVEATPSGSYQTGPTNFAKITFTTYNGYTIHSVTAQIIPSYSGQPAQYIEGTVSNPYGENLYCSVELQSYMANPNCSQAAVAW